VQLKIQFNTLGVDCFHGQPPIMDDPHNHTEIELNRLDRGRVVYKFAGEKVTFSPGKLYVFSGLRPHQMTDRSEDALMSWVTFPAWHIGMWGLPEDFTLHLTSGAVVVDDDMHEYQRDAVRFERWRQDIAAGELRYVRLFLLEIRARMERLSLSPNISIANLFSAGRANHLGKSGEAVVNMQGYILRHLSDPLRVADIARHVGLNPNYATTVFKRHTGLTMNEFLVRQRLDFAKLLLVSTDRKVVDVAFEAGFGSLSRFYEAFAFAFGISPANFRKLASN